MAILLFLNRYARGQNAHCKIYIYLRAWVRNTLNLHHYQRVNHSHHHVDRLLWIDSAKLPLRQRPERKPTSCEPLLINLVDHFSKVDLGNRRVSAGSR